jgi:hypothetical protein
MPTPANTGAGAVAVDNSAFGGPNATQAAAANAALDVVAPAPASTKTSSAPATPTPVVSSNPGQTQLGQMQNLSTSGTAAITAQNAKNAAVIPTGWSATPPATGAYSTKATPNGPIYQAAAPTPPAPTPTTPEQDVANEGTKVIYNVNDASQSTRVPVGEAAPVGWSETNPNPLPTAPMVATASLSDGSSIQQLSDGTYANYNSNGQYTGPGNAKNFSDAQGLQSTTAKIQQLSNGTYPLTANEQAQVTALQASFEELITQQQTANANLTGGTTVAMNLYGMGNSVSGLGEIKGTIDSGLAKVADLNSKMSAAVTALTTSLEDEDLKMAQAAYTTYNDALAERQKNIDDLNTAAADALKTANAAQAQVAAAAKTAAAAVTSQINTVADDALKAGAPQSVIDAINKTGTVQDALAATGNYLQTSSDPTMQKYIDYRDAAQTAGQVPKTFDTWKEADDAATLKSDSAKAYATAYATESGKAAATPAAPGTDTVPGLAQQLVDGLLAPAELSKRSTGVGSYSSILDAANKYSMATYGKPFDIATADRNYKFANNVQTQNTLNYLGSLVGSDDGSGKIVGGNLDALISSSNLRNPEDPTNPILNFLKNGPLGGTTSFPALNNTEQWAKLQTGDPQIAAYYTTLLEVSDQTAKILQGGGSGGGTSDAKLAQAQNLFQKGFTPDQISAVASSLKTLLMSRGTSMVKDNPYLSDYAQQFGVTQNNNKPVDPQVQSSQNNPLQLPPLPTNGVSSTNPIGI